MKYAIDPTKKLFRRDKMLYGHFIEHFHRQIYGGVYDPGNPLSDDMGFRTDVLDAMRAIEVPILRWPGGCFVSAYHWKNAVGPNRIPYFDKAWHVEEPCTFGTDEYIELCRRIGCEPYICTNAGTGNAEEMSDWVEYCNLKTEGIFAKQRIANGYPEPHNVKYWSIGNENWGDHEIGAKPASEWGRLVNESAKMMQRVDPEIELSAAALTDLDWNLNVLRSAGHRLKWISIHEYWDGIQQSNEFATYEQSIAYTDSLDRGIRKVRGLLSALEMENRIRIAFDEWNLRGWYHPDFNTYGRGLDRQKDILDPRDHNDDNYLYTMADTVFTACFLNTCNRNADIVGMANFAPIVNTRGCIYTHKDGIVLRGTYYVFYMYVKLLGDTILDLWTREKEVLHPTDRWGRRRTVDAVDVLATLRNDGITAVSAINKDAESSRTVSFAVQNAKKYRIHTLNGESCDSYNDIDVNGITLRTGEWTVCTEEISVTLEPHSVNVIEIDTMD